MKTSFYRSLLLLGVLVILLTGCSTDLNMVTGTVTLDGEPVAGAFIRFTPTTEGSGDGASGISKADGTYTIQTSTGKPGGGTTVGKYAVTFSKLEERWDGRTYYDESFSPGERVRVMHGVEILPVRYTIQTTSPFTVTVERGRNVFDFELKTNP